MLLINTFHENLVRGGKISNENSIPMDSPTSDFSFFSVSWTKKNIQEQCQNTFLNVKLNQTFGW